jgi:cobalt/nickel transport protein
VSVRAPRGVATAWVALGILLVTLLLAGVVSHYASDSPDGLNRVAQDQGFSATERQHAADDSPLAGYDSSGIDDPRLSGGVAGVAGVVVVLLLAGGVAYAVRRRSRADDDRTVA